jgi:hypothetical protein
MLQELFQLLLWQFYMITFFFIVGLIAQLINMGAGAYVNRANFDFKKLLGGFRWVVILYALVLGIVELFSVLQFGLAYFNIVYLDVETFELLSAVSVSVVIVWFSLSKLKDALLKLQDEFGYKKEETELFVRQDETAEG